MLSIKPKRKQEPISPTFTSPAKKKKGNEEEEEGEEELSATQVDFLDDMDATQVDFMDGEEKKEVCAYKLTAFGEDDVVNSVNEKEIAGKWSDTPFSVGRIMFLSMSDEHKSRISRKHFEIHCCINQETYAKELWLVDKSANGTMVDGELGYLGKRTLLEDGSAIGLLLTVAKDRILFGYSFSSPHAAPKKVEMKPKNPLKLPTKVNGGTKTKASAPIKSEKINGGTTNGEKLNGKGAEKSNGKGSDKAVFAIPALPAPKASMSIKPKSGFMQGVRFALVGYTEAALADDKKKKLIQDLRDQGATYVLRPDPTNVDVVVLNRNYFKEPASYDVNLQQLTSSLHVRFTGTTRWLEECLRERRKIDLRGEILPPSTGGVIVIDTSDTSSKGTTKKGNTTLGLEPRIAAQLASMLREEKRAVGAKWKIIAPLSVVAACGGMVEGLEGIVEIMKSTQKGDKERERGDYLLGVRESQAAGYRHVVWLVNVKEKEAGMSGVDKVVSMVDGSGFIEFAQTLHAQRKEGQATNGKK